jgi:hypothetical protein
MVDSLKISRLGRTKKREVDRLSFVISVLDDFRDFIDHLIPLTPGTIEEIITAGNMK